MLNRLLAHPRTRGLDIDSPQTTQLRREIIRSKPFLTNIYRDWYREILKEVTAESILELGSGAGFLSELAPRTITSDLFIVQGLQVVADGQQLPFDAASLGNVAMINVLHHVPSASQLFSETARCVKAGGKFVMIEPWITSWSRFVYTTLHHEPLDEKASVWKITGSGPLSGANSALPWIIFERDLARFEREHSEWRIDKVTPFMPLRYLLSGGVSLRNLMPAFTYPLWRSLEALQERYLPRFAMFAKIVLTRKN